MHLSFVLRKPCDSNARSVIRGLRCFGDQASVMVSARDLAVPEQVLGNIYMNF